MRRLVLGFALALLPFLGVPAHASAPASTGTSLRPYVLNAGNQRHLRPLDPLSLRYQRSAPDLLLPRVSSAGDAWVVASRNGQYLAEMRFHHAGGNVWRSKNITNSVMNVRTQHITSFHPAGPFYLDGITPDGRAVFGREIAPDGQSIEGWALVSTADGRLLHEVPLGLSTATQLYFDPAAMRLYAFEAVYNGVYGATSAPPSLEAFDVTTGRRIAHLTLNGILAGSWGAGTQANGDPAVNIWDPGVALRPDGAQLDVLDGNSDHLLAINTHTMNVVRSMSLSRPASPLARLGGWLGIAPQAALAKEQDGTQLNMSFGPDGRSLYVTGMKSGLNARGKQTVAGLGVRRIDPDTGTIAARALRGRYIAQLWPAGSALYALVVQLAGSAHTPPTLYRLDPTTLRIEARHRFLHLAVWPSIYLLAR